MNFALFNLLLKLSIPVNFLAKVPEGLALGVEKEIVELGEPQLDLLLRSRSAALLLVALLRRLVTGCCLCHCCVCLVKFR